MTMPFGHFESDQSFESFEVIWITGQRSQLIFSPQTTPPTVMPWGLQPLMLSGLQSQLDPMFTLQAAE
ncbi:5433_t:CDS:2, partial [Rhizophagus irregularis]